MTYKTKLYDSAIQSYNAYLQNEYFPIHDAKFISNNDIGGQCYTWIHDTKRITVFRGTNEKQDVIQDLDILRIKIPNISKKCLVHKGFLDSFMCLEETLSKIIEEDENINILEFKGHSLGGAVATIAALYYKDLYKTKKVICHTFGSPRVGSKGFVKYFNKIIDESIRVVNERDLVPTIPMSWRFKHVNNCIELKADCSMSLVKQDIPWYKRLCKVSKHIDVFNPVGEHKCAVYILRLY